MDINENKNLKIPRIVLITLVLAFLGLGVYGLGFKTFESRTTWPTTKPTEPSSGQRVERAASSSEVKITGKLVFEATIKGYVIVGDPKFPHSVFIKNSSDVKVVAALKPLIGKTVTVYGTKVAGGLGDAIIFSRL